MFTVIPILIVVALIVVLSAIKIVPQGFQWTVETFWSLYQNTDARPEYRCTVYGSCWP